MIYNIDGGYMKRVLFFITIITFLSILAFVILIKADGKTLTEEKALQIGEEKYLTFLWMVDGAFNSERLKEDFKVNNKSLSEEDKIFTCKYKKAKSKECVGNNFESEFKKLFSDTIDYENVYSDGVLYSWIAIKDGQYVFNNLDSCNINRMGTNQSLRLVNLSNDKIEYEVSFNNSQTNQVNKRDFVLVMEDNEWKISSAFYYDLCGMKYTVY